MTDADLKKLSDWHNIPEKDMVWIDNRIKKWIEIQSNNKSAPSFEPWTEANEKALGELEKHHFYLHDTHLGSLEAQQQTEFEDSLDRMQKDAAVEYLARLTLNTLGNDSRSNSYFWCKIERIAIL